jgi:hypothetical protein
MRKIMTINVESWKTLFTSGCDLFNPLHSLAKAADVDSIENAFEAGLAVAGKHELLTAVAQLADAAASDGVVPKRVEKLLFQWAAEPSPDDLAKTLTSLVWNTPWQHEAIGVLVRVGADPYKKVSTNKTGYGDSNVCAIEKALGLSVEESLNVMRALIGSDSITDPAQLPRLLPYSNIFLPQPFIVNVCNVLERAIIGSNMNVVEWIVDRIDRNSPARRLLCDLGDVALRLLGMDSSGYVLPKHETIEISHANIAMAYSFLVAGAEFDDPRMWQKIAGRKIRNYGDQTFLFTAVQTDYKMLRPESLTAAIRIFLDKDLLDINATDANGHTMLMSAAKCNRADLIDLLLQRGANVATSITIEGKKRPIDALHYAKKSRNPDMIRKILAATAKDAISRTIELAKARRSSSAQGAS